MEELNKHLIDNISKINKCVIHYGAYMLNNKEDIIEFLDNKKKLYENIKKLGLRKNINNNIEFMIDRNQHLVKINSGNHRFAISRIL